MTTTMTAEGASTWRKRLIGDLSWRRLVVTLGGGYALFAGLLWTFADALIFPAHPAGYRDGPGHLKLALPTGERVTALWLPNPAARHTILYSHGNGEDLADVAPTIQALHGLGFAVFAYEFPGYGTSDGKPSCEGATAAIRAAYAHVTGPLGVAPSRLIAHGRSIGGGPTLALAANQPLAGLILESTFTSVRAVRFPFPIVPFDRFRSQDALAGLTLPTLVMHGREDQTIPFPHGEALFATARGPKRNLWIDGAGHDDLQDYAGERWGQAIRAFARELVGGG